MNAFAKLAIGLTAVAVISLVAINMLAPRSDSGVGGPVVTPSPTPSPSPTPTLRPLPTPPTADEFPPVGPLSVGTHAATYSGKPISFDIPTDGWTVGQGNEIVKGTYGGADFAGLDLWLDAPDNVYADPCKHTPLDPKPASTVDAMAAAVAAVPGTTLVTGPSVLEIGGRPARYLELTINEDLACKAHDAYLWYDDSSGGATGGWRWAEGLGATYRVWLIDAGGTLVWVDAYTFKGAPPELDQEIRGIVESIRFE